jgi:hypothetical protein
MNLCSRSAARTFSLRKHRIERQKKTLLAFRFVFAVKLEVVLVLGGAVDVLVLDLEKSLLGKQILVIVQT